MNKSNLFAAVADLITVPAHINAAANACRYDLMHGPSYVRIPAGDVTKFTDDDLATFRDDASEGAEPDDVIAETYISPVADALREFIVELPGTLYYDDDCGCISETEPEGEEVDGEWFDPSPYYIVESRDVVEALFGQTIAREFN